MQVMPHIKFYYLFEYFFVISTIQVYFLEQFLRLSFRYDWLEVRDGGDENATLIGRRYCGNFIPAPLVSSGNKLFVRFHSDSSQTYAGYRIKADLGRLFEYENILD